MKTALISLALIICNYAASQKADDSMVLIRAGEFIMGKNTATPSDWQPEHTVKINSFYMEKYEVTNQEYYNFCIAARNPLPQFWGMKEFKSGLDFPDYPVVGVSYTDAEKYARWSGKRLPTEAEWEYASRGGLSGKNFPLGDSVDSTFVNYGRKYKGVLKVGSFRPNGYGLYDITGNVWEWTSDFYDNDYYAISPVENPMGPESGRFRVIRGGSWHSGTMCVQTFYRNGLSPGWVDFAVGFRCVKDVK
jgi:formylglycine-generating enzyme required for sulfatase activity